MSDEKALPGVIVFGLDPDRKPRAGLFGTQAAKQATARGKELKFVVAPIEGPALTGLAGELAQGDLGKEGAAFVPVVTRTLYERLLVASGVVGSRAPTQERKASLPPPRLPASWADIAVGDLVLAEDPIPGDGWWEARVVEAVQPDLFRIAFRDFPEEGEHARRRDQLALLPPSTPLK